MNVHNFRSPFTEDTVIFFTYVEGDQTYTDDDVDIILPIENITVVAGGTPVVQRTIDGVEVGNLIVVVNSTGGLDRLVILYVSSPVYLMSHTYKRNKI